MHWFFTVGIALCTAWTLFVWGVTTVVHYPLASRNNFDGIFNPYVTAWFNTGIAGSWGFLLAASFASVMFGWCEKSTDIYKRWSVVRLSFIGFFFGLILMIHGWGVWSHYDNLEPYNRFELLGLNPDAVIPSPVTGAQTTAYLRLMQKSQVYIDFNIIYMSLFDRIFVCTSLIVLKVIHYAYVYWLLLSKKARSEKSASKKLNVGNSVASSSLGLAI